MGGSKQRALLTLLLLHANETISTHRLIDELGGEPPATAAKTVQVHVSRVTDGTTNFTPAPTQDAAVFRFGTEQIEIGAS